MSVSLRKHDEHVYYWAWREEDNEDCDFRNPKWFRVFRAGVHINDPPITEAMSRDEAIAYCERIVKLTGGREL